MMYKAESMRVQAFWYNTVTYGLGGKVSAAGI